ncbi:alpha/beta hydrolase family esterase [Sphingomonas carotinifaciens]|uniref:Esterase, PHB depolymerase family n=1 Tax=Sphingomonas carotinifaciens TaxID=1166323 RepID=A0A1G7FJU6_9SPHN|nr:PHB depolymerase family esterase [Sphingomonas carotinifaciens]MBB4086121.1 poly(hydroxyalkanoate) depolymerase family esterase [Sphingomonas carotinifaciens]MWC42447.1 PHB depolymerase family esterase [Sphingomonas carotinifaciens]SDE76201.1 esterase, PHB depolymerase family [Sphingomonas carotinifaciens]
MRKISDTVGRLAALRGAGAMNTGLAPDSSRLTRLDAFGSNPGALHGYVHIPAALAPDAPLVVVLHGCTQTAAGYDLGAGWSDMADRYGFAVLFPEQQRQNNPNLCFNWFNPEDSRHGTGEALSIRQMIAAVTARHAIDPARVFVTGLSAGGAMASVMLATYPEVFAGGAIIAGLPYGSATTMPQAFDRMRGHGIPGEDALAALVRDASDHDGPWPTISIWHGSGDATVAPSNADAIIRQWRSLHGANARPDRQETVDGYPRRVWHDASGWPVIEEYSITGMGHGTPLAVAGDDRCGQAGAYMLDASISSTRHIGRFWGLIPADDVRESAAPRTAVLERMPPPAPRTAEPPEPAGASANVGKVIEDALRAAGLMR